MRSPSRPKSSVPSRDCSISAASGVPTDLPKQSSEQILIHLFERAVFTQHREETLRCHAVPFCNNGEHLVDKGRKMKGRWLGRLAPAFQQEIHYCNRSYEAETECIDGMSIRIDVPFRRVHTQHSRLAGTDAPSVPDAGAGRRRRTEPRSGPRTRRRRCRSRAPTWTCRQPLSGALLPSTFFQGKLDVLETSWRGGDKIRWKMLLF